MRLLRRRRKSRLPIPGLTPRHSRSRTRNRKTPKRTTVPTKAATCRRPRRRHSYHIYRSRLPRRYRRRSRRARLQTREQSRRLLLPSRFLRQPLLPPAECQPSAPLRKRSRVQSNPQARFTSLARRRQLRMRRAPLRRRRMHLPRHQPRRNSERASTGLTNSLRISSRPTKRTPQTSVHPRRAS